MSWNSSASKTSPHSRHSTYSVSSCRETIRTLGCLQAVAMVLVGWKLDALAADCSDLFGNFKPLYGESSHRRGKKLRVFRVFGPTCLKYGHKRSYTKHGPKKSYIMLKLTKKADYGLMALKYLAERSDTVALSAK